MDKKAFNNLMEAISVVDEKYKVEYETLINDMYHTIDDIMSDSDFDINYYLYALGEYALNTICGYTVPCNIIFQYDKDYKQIVGLQKKLVSKKKNADKKRKSIYSQIMDSSLEQAKANDELILDIDIASLICKGLSKSINGAHIKQILNTVFVEYDTGKMINIIVAYSKNGVDNFKFNGKTMKTNFENVIQNFAQKEYSTKGKYSKIIKALKYIDYQQMGLDDKKMLLNSTPLLIENLLYNIDDSYYTSNFYETLILIVNKLSVMRSTDFKRLDDLGDMFDYGSEYGTMQKDTMQKRIQDYIDNNVELLKNNYKI